MSKKKITPEIIKQAYQLSTKGYPNTLIAETIQISQSTLYACSEIMEAIKKGRSVAKSKVIDILMDRSIEDQSPTALIYLSKQLKVFDTYFGTSQPKNAIDATSRIAKIYDEVSKNNLDQEKADRLVSYLDKYIKAYEISELEERINKLEDNAL